MTCIADKYPGAIDRLRANGAPAIAAMAEALPTAKAIDEALGHNGAASHWLRGTNNISKASERAAELWVASRLNGSAKTEPREDAATDDTVLMVVCPPEKSAKVQKVLRLLDCEVEAI